MGWHLRAHLKREVAPSAHPGDSPARAHLGLAAALADVAPLGQRQPVCWRAEPFICLQERRVTVVDILPLLGGTVCTRSVPVSNKEAQEGRAARLPPSARRARQR